MIFDAFDEQRDGETRVFLPSRPELTISDGRLLCFLLHGVSSRTIWKIMNMFLPQQKRITNKTRLQVILDFLAMTDHLLP